MALDFTTLSPEELVAAESAALTMRALLEAVKTAPHGHGMATVEAVIQDKGMTHLRTLLTTAMTSHGEAQKKRGVQPALYLREKGLVQAVQGKNDPEQRGARGGGPAVLRLSSLQGQADALGAVGGPCWQAPPDAERQADDCAGRQRLFLRPGGL